MVNTPNPANPLDPAVQAFANAFGLQGAVISPPFQSQGYDPDFCHVSTKVHAMANGGRRVHGWALWEWYPGFVMGDFHSLWEDTTGALVDVTPPKFGFPAVRFIADPTVVIARSGPATILHVNRVNPPHDPYWFGGKPVAQRTWALPDSNPSLAAYCAKYSFAPADMATTQPFG